MKRGTWSAVLWDLDGTLVSTKRLYLEAYRRALMPYIGRAITDDEILASRARSEIRFLQKHVTDQYEACVEDFRRHYRELHSTHFEGIYDGVLEMLDTLRQRGVSMGIVTGKSRSSWETMIATADLGQFDVLVFDDDVTQPKPSPEGILAAVEALHADAADVLYVGDSATDIFAAHAAGCRSAGALWSKGEAQRRRFLEQIEGEKGVLLLETPLEILPPSLRL